MSPSTLPFFLRQSCNPNGSALYFHTLTNRFSRNSRFCKSICIAGGWHGPFSSKPSDAATFRGQLFLIQRLAHSYASLCTVSKMMCLVFSRLRTLCAKHRGWDAYYGLAIRRAHGAFNANVTVSSFFVVFPYKFALSPFAVVFTLRMPGAGVSSSRFGTHWEVLCSVS